MTSALIGDCSTRFRTHRFTENVGLISGVTGMRFPLYCAPTGSVIPGGA